MHSAETRPRDRRYRNAWHYCRRGVLHPAVCVLAMLPVLSGCDLLLDVAGLQRKSEQEETAVRRQIEPEHSAREEKQRDVSTAVADVQQMLNALGYDAGPVDGIMGPRTAGAIREFQADANLPVDGRISRELSSSLQAEQDFRMGLNGSGENASPAVSGATEGPARVSETPEPVDEADPAAGTVALSTAAAYLEGQNRVYGFADEPYYEPGDNFIYSNGRIETAVRIKDDMVYWVVNDGSRYTTSKNFVLPPVEWEDRAGTVVSTVEMASGEAWPPAARHPISFTVKPRIGNGIAQFREAWSGDWRCRTDGESGMSVPAGRFDVIRIECEKTGPGPKEWRKVAWYYSPDIRHFVRKEVFQAANAEPSVMDLIAIRPGRSNWTRSARTGFDWAVQKLLDGGRIKDSIQWKVANSGIELDITLTGQMAMQGDVLCRRYLVVRKNPGNPRGFPALACRSGGAGRWKIPGLEKGAILPEDVIALR